MTDLSNTIIAKSDQLNADDLIGREITIKVTGVGLFDGDQPVAINYEGDNGKPWRPCKSMRRVLVGVWGADGNEYIGRSLTLYRDPKVKWAGQEVGGIRISHMSHIDKPVTLSLTATKQSKKPFTVKPLAVTSAAPMKAQTAPANGASKDSLAEESKNSLIQTIGELTSTTDAEKFSQDNAQVLKRLNEAYTDKYDEIMTALTSKQNELMAAGDPGF